jgi:uncharacterized membrane protein
MKRISINSLSLVIVITISVAGLLLILNPIQNVAKAYSCSSGASAPTFSTSSSISGTTGSCFTSSTSTSSGSLAGTTPVNAPKSSCSGQANRAVLIPEFGTGCAVAGAASTSGGGIDAVGVQLANNKDPSNCNSAAVSATHGFIEDEHSFADSHGSVSCGQASR